MSMDIARRLRIGATCAVLFLAGCDDDSDEWRPTPLQPREDASQVQSGGDAGTDAAAAADAGTPQDGATALDSTAAADVGTGTDSGQDASSIPDAASDAATDATADAGLLASGSGSWTIFTDPYGDGGANPAMNIQGSAAATRAGDGGMQVTLNVSGLPAARGFGSHLHKLACTEMSAGGHFQHNPASAADAAVSDPAFANPTNEVWLDFTTDDAGVAIASATVGWIPGDGGASAIIVHDRLTGDGGVAGPKLACLPFPF
jgi:Cu-Zn family superoxide dismutase